MLGIFATNFILALYGDAQFQLYTENGRRNGRQLQDTGLNNMTELSDVQQLILRMEGGEYPITYAPYNYENNKEFFPRFKVGALEWELKKEWRHNDQLLNPCLTYGNKWDVGVKDLYRKPLETIYDFMGVKPGMKVAELGRLNGYWVPLLRAAVGPHGKVYHGNPGVFAMENDFVGYLFHSRKVDPQTFGYQFTNDQTWCDDNKLMETQLERAGYKDDPAVPFLDMTNGFKPNFGSDHGDMDVVAYQYVLNYQSANFLNDTFADIFSASWSALKPGGKLFIVDMGCGDKGCDAGGFRFPESECSNVIYTSPESVHLCDNAIITKNIHHIGTTQQLRMDDTNSDFHRWLDVYKFDCTALSRLKKEPCITCEFSREQNKACAYEMAEMVYDNYVEHGWPKYKENFFQKYGKRETYTEVKSKRVTIDGIPNQPVRATRRIDVRVFQHELKKLKIYEHCHHSYAFRNPTDDTNNPMWVGGSYSKPDRDAIICTKPNHTPKCGTIKKLYQAANCCGESADTYATCSS